MEWLSPMTNDTVGLLREVIISASASPQLTSPPMVFTRIRTPPIFSSLSTFASSGRICSYFVVFVLPDRLSCPSISPMIDKRWILFPFSSSVTCPFSRIRSSSAFVSFCSFSFITKNSFLTHQVHPVCPERSSHIHFYHNIPDQDLFPITSTMHTGVL